MEIVASESTRAQAQGFAWQELDRVRVKGKEQAVAIYRPVAEAGALDADQPPLQTWLVRQGVVLTPEGQRGLAMTLRAPVPWLAGQAPPAAGAVVVPGPYSHLTLPAVCRC